MQTVVCVWFPNWPLQRLLHEQPELRSRPVIVYSTAGRGKQVVSVSRLPFQQGVRRGMPLAEAEAILARPLTNHPETKIPEACFQPLDAAADLDKLRQLAIDCERFTP